MADRSLLSGNVTSHAISNSVLGSVACLPASLVSTLFLLNVVNPMALVFLTNFDVLNASGEDLSITPVGAIGSSGRRTTLPLSLASSLSIPSPRDRSFPLASGARRTFTYDWDDVQFSEILIVSRSGSAKELVVDVRPTESRYRPPSTNHFVVPALDSLPTARPEVRAVLRTQQARLWIIWAVVLIGLAAPIALVYAAVQLKAT